MEREMGMERFWGTILGNHFGERFWGTILGKASHSGLREPKEEMCGSVEQYCLTVSASMKIGCLATQIIYSSMI